MELAVEEILKTQNSFGEVMDIVAHEMIHVLDYLDDDNGILPGWSVAQVEEFMAARDLVRRSIMRGKSVIHRYALVSPEEFIAVLGEVYFTQPDALKDTNIILFELMDTYFHPPKKTSKR
ncbi:MAG: zinc-dependent peptidase [Vampirovibrionales bacterium]